MKRFSHSLGKLRLLTAPWTALSAFPSFAGLEHHTLSIPWNQPPFPNYPAPHKTEAPARAARMLLYRQLFRQECIASLWTGHHRGDQVENLLMRGRGMQSVARMDGGGLEEPEEQERRIVRPLLGFDKVRRNCSRLTIAELTTFISTDSTRRLLQQTLTSLLHRPYQPRSSAHTTQRPPTDAH